MAAEGIEKKLTWVRPPRVSITYEIRVGDVIEMKELPFVVGVLADLAGNSPDRLLRLRDRKFIDIDRDNFNSVLQGLKPQLVYLVKNRLSNNQTPIDVDLRFEGIQDFDPEQV